MSAQVTPKQWVRKVEIDYYLAQPWTWNVAQDNAWLAASNEFLRVMDTVAKERNLTHAQVMLQLEAMIPYVSVAGQDAPGIMELKDTVLEFVRAFLRKTSLHNDEFSAISVGSMVVSRIVADKLRAGTSL